MTATATRSKPVPASTSSGLFDTIAQMGHEQLVLCSDPSASYRGIIAVHSTTLGPALGGTRFWSYASDEEAIIDALFRLWIALAIKQGRGRRLALRLLEG